MSDPRGTNTAIKLLRSRVHVTNDMTNFLTALSVKSGKGGKRVENIAALIAGGAAVSSAVKQAKAKYEAHKAANEYTVSIDATDEIYPLVQTWVLQQMTPSQQKALTAHSVRTKSHTNTSALLARLRSRIRSGGGTPGAGLSSAPDFSAVKDVMDLMLAYDGTREQTLTISGHKINVKIEKPGATGQNGDDIVPDSFAGGMSMNLRNPRVVFSARSTDGRDAVVAVLTDLLKAYDRERTENRLFTATKWGDWTNTSGVPPRSMGTVILAEGAADDLITDITTFLESEERYAALGLPWHRGYLLHGPPGTGKTSLIKALATHLGLDMYYMPLSDLNKDTDLSVLVTGITSRGMLLIEDIDVAHSSRNRDDEVGGVTTAGLLNALDGVATPHGLITVMTTNNLDVLDPALVRPGRADRVFAIDYMEQEQYKRLCELIAGRSVDDVEIADISGTKSLSPAEVLEWAKSDLSDPEIALKNVTEKTFDWLKEAKRRV